jgi:hypothetical protein
MVGDCLVSTAQNRWFRHTRPTRGASPKTGGEHPRSTRRHRRWIASAVASGAVDRRRRPETVSWHGHVVTVRLTCDVGARRARCHDRAKPRFWSWTGRGSDPVHPVRAVPINAQIRPNRHRSGRTEPAFGRAARPALGGNGGGRLTGGCAAHNDGVARPTGLTRRCRLGPPGNRRYAALDERPITNGVVEQFWCNPRCG